MSSRRRDREEHPNARRNLPSAERSSRTRGMARRPQSASQLAKRLGMETVPWSARSGGSVGPMAVASSGGESKRPRSAVPRSGRSSPAAVRRAAAEAARATLARAGSSPTTLPVSPVKAMADTLASRSAAPTPLRSTRTTVSSPKSGSRRKATKNLGMSGYHATQVRVVAGQLVAQPHKLSKKPFLIKESPSSPYGSHSSILNAAPMTSEAGSHFRRLRPQSAGASRKQPVPYSMNAARNRLPPNFGAATKFNASSLQLKYGVDAVGKPARPFESVARASQAPLAAGPEHARAGFTNPAIAAERARFVKRLVIE